MPDKLVLGLYIKERSKNVPMVQTILTEYGCFIKSRIGLHEVVNDKCSPNGLIIIECCGNEKKCEMMAKKLAKIDGVEVQKMIFKT